MKIYPIKRKGTPYRFFQIAWYELGGRRTKTFADPIKAKSYAQQVQVSLLNLGRVENVTPQDIQMLRDAEAMAAKFSVSLPFAIREWADARSLLGPAILGSAKSLADALHGLKEVTTADAVEQFIESKRKAGMSKRHFQTLCTLLRPFGSQFKLASISNVSAKEVEDYVAKIRGGARTKNNVVATLKSLFTWAQRRGHLRADRPPVTAGLQKLRLSCPTPEIFSPADMVKILEAAQTHEPAMMWRSATWPRSPLLRTAAR